MNADRLANAYLKLKQYDKAEPVLLEVPAALQATRPKNHPEHNAGRGRLYNLYRRWGKPEQAKRYAPPKKASPKKSG